MGSQTTKMAWLQAGSCHSCLAAANGSAANPSNSTLGFKVNQPLCRHQLRESLAVPRPTSIRTFNLHSNAARIRSGIPPAGKMTDAASNTRPKRFYRVRVLP